MLRYASAPGPSALGDNAGMSSEVAFGSSVQGSWRDILNPAILRGGLAITLGSLVLLLPQLTITIVQVGVAVAVLGSAIYDL